jgi:hypothetical protein
MNELFSVDEIKFKFDIFWILKYHENLLIHPMNVFYKSECMKGHPFIQTYSKTLELDISWMFIYEIKKNGWG